MADGTFTIGELARRTAVKVETIRYYEKIDLLPQPPRSDGGHRRYTPDHARRLTFIRRSRDLGFTLDDVRTLLDLAERGPCCADIRETAAAHLEDVRCKIADLQRMERTLAATVARCEADTSPTCPIIAELSGHA